MIRGFDLLICVMFLGNVRDLGLSLFPIARANLQSLSRIGIKPHRYQAASVSSLLILSRQPVIIFPTNTLTFWIETATSDL